MQVYRGLPKPLIKFINEENIRILLQNTEYKSMQYKDMHQIDENLYFIIEEKNKTIELTYKGRNFLSKDISDTNFFLNIKNDLKEELLKEFCMK